MRDAPEGLAERVVRGAVGEVHRESGREARARELPTRVGVRAVGDGPCERLRNVSAGFEAERQRERRRVPHRAAADRLGERVDPGVRGRPCREPVREHGVDERVLRAHVRMPEADLAVVLGVGQDAGTRDLAPGAGGRRAEDETDPRRRGSTTARCVVGGRAALVGHEPCRLRDVERRASADPHDGVVGRHPNALGQLVGESEGRLSGALHEALETNAGRLARHERSDDVEVLGDGLFDDDQRAPCLEALEDARELVDDAVSEGDPDRQVRRERGQ